MICNHVNSEGISGANGRQLHRSLKRAFIGMAWIALGGMMSGCSGGGTVASSNGGGPGAVPEAAFSIDPSTNMVSVFTVNSVTGTWTGTGSAATGSGPQAVAVHPSGKFLYVANANSGTISAFSIDATTAALTPITGSPFAVSTPPQSLAIDSSGNFLYVSTVTTTTPPMVGVHLLLGFSISATGALTPIMQAQVLSNTTSIGLTFAPTSEFLYAADAANDVTGYAANAATGVLTAVPGSPFPAGTAPFGIVASGKFVYVTNTGSGNVSGYAIDAISGGLTPVPMSPFASGLAPAPAPSAVVVEHTGKFLYIVNTGELDIAEFSISATTGGLSFLPTSPFVLPAGTVPTTAAVDAAGTFLYVVNKTGNNISIFVIQNNGSLNPLGTMLTGSGNVSGIAFRAGHS
jgi:6-phosphogluconolactonase